MERIGKSLHKKVFFCTVAILNSEDNRVGNCVQLWRNTETKKENFNFPVGLPDITV